jgi:hypothetical protein
MVAGSPRQLEPAEACRTGTEMSAATKEITSKRRVPLFIAAYLLLR